MTKRFIMIIFFLTLMVYGVYLLAQKNDRTAEVQDSSIGYINTTKAESIEENTSLDSTIPEGTGPENPADYSLEAEIKEELDSTDTYAFSYDYWTDFREEWDLPYADEKTFDQVKKAYAEVDFFGEFEKGDVNVYDKYISKYYELLQNNMPVYDPETDMYIPVMEYDDFGWYYEDYGQTNFEYYLFDIDGDESPEMAIQTYGHGYYVFDYNADTEEYSVWYPMGGIWYRIIGTRKVQWAGEGRYLAFYQLDERGEEECETFIFSRYENEEIYLCMVMLPKYADSSKEIAVTEEMKNQGVYEKSSGQWYFRITQEQFDELSKEYVEAHELAMKQREEVSYTYEELFGSFSTPEIQM